MAKPKTVRVGNVTVTEISPKEGEVLAEKIKQRHDLMRNRYREIHGKNSGLGQLLVRGRQLVREYPVHGQDRFFIAVQSKDPYREHRPI